MTDLRARCLDCGIPIPEPGENPEPSALVCDRCYDSGLPADSLSVIAAERAGKHRGLKAYIGDSVYVSFDGNGLTLTTENGLGATNIVYLEPEVWEALKLYVDGLGRAPAMAHCDVCDQMKPAEGVRLLVAAGMETWACDECRSQNYPKDVRP